MPVKKKPKSERKTSDAQLRATAKYEAENTKRFTVKVNKRTESDILEALTKQESMQGYIKRLIREDIAKNG